MNITLVQDASVEPVTVADMKTFLRIDSSFTDDDTQMALFISAARQEGEAACGRELAAKQWTLALDCFPSNWLWPYVSRVAYPLADSAGSFLYEFVLSRSEIRLLDPLTTVDLFTYKKSDGSVVTMVANTDYVADILKHPGIVTPTYGKAWPSDDLWPTSAVQIKFTAGYGSNCPARYKQGIMLLVSQWYEGRIPFEAIRFVAELPFSVTSLFASDKIWRF